MKTKQCSKCKEAKLVEGFSKSSKAGDGLQRMCKSCFKNYRKTNKEAIAQGQKQWREANKESLADQRKQHYQNNKERLLKKSKQHYQDNKDQILDQQKQYNQDNRDKTNAYYRKRRSTDSSFRLVGLLRNRIKSALNGTAKASSTFDLIGCDRDHLVFHIESQFTEGMSWDKMGMHGIHIDHIRPCASFDLSDPEQQRECFHYTNLQPLWAKDNLKKSDKW